MGTLFDQLPYKEKVTKGNLKSLIRDIKDVQKDTGLEFYEVIQAYELRLKITKADTLDEQLAGFGKLIDRFVGNGEFDLGVRYLCDALEGISSSLDYIGDTQGNFKFYDKQAHLQANEKELEEKKEMKEKISTSVIQKLYEDAKISGDMLVDSLCMFDDKFERVNSYELSTFHPKSSSLLYHHEEYFCGIRASGHIVIFGNTQLDDRECVVVQGNHKGDMLVTAFYINETNSHNTLVKE